MPSAVVVIGIDRVAHAACDVGAKHDRIDQLPAVRAAVLGQGERCGGNRSARMNDGLEMRVVEVEGVRADTVEQRRSTHVDALMSAENAHLRCGLEILERCKRRCDCAVARRADRASHPVEKSALRLAFDELVPAAGWVLRHEVREHHSDWRNTFASRTAGTHGVCVAHH